MSYILVHFKGNCLDEFDVHGFSVMTPEEWAEKVSKIDLEDVKEIQYGTNEYLYYRSVEQFLSDFWQRPISEKEAGTIKKLFKKSYGFFPL